MKKMLMAAFAAAMLGSATLASASTDFWRVIGISTGVYLNMRVAPGIDAAVVLQLPPNRVNLIVDRCEMRGGRDWCYVNAGGQHGWVAKNYIRQMTPTERQRHPYHPENIKNNTQKQGQHAQPKHRKSAQQPRAKQNNRVAQVHHNQGMNKPQQGQGHASAGKRPLIQNQRENFQGQPH